MDSLGNRLFRARKARGLTQEALASAIGVSRGVIFNLEKDKTEPQAIVANALCRTLQIEKSWLLTGEGQMEPQNDLPKSARVLSELYALAKGLTEEELLFLLDTIQALKRRFPNER